MTYPFVSWSSNTIFVKFVEKDLVIDSIKRLGEVKEYTDHKVAPLQGVDNTIHKCDNGHFRRVFFPESKLKLK